MLAYGFLLFVTLTSPPAYRESACKFLGPRAPASAREGSWREAFGLTRPELRQMAMPFYRSTRRAGETL